MLQYAQDYDERTPLGASTHIAAHASVWDGTAPYMKSQQLLGCPSDSLKNCLSLQAGVSGYWGAEWASWAVSYGYNYAVGQQSLAQFQYVAETACLAEMTERPYFYQQGAALANGGIGIGYTSAPQRLSTERHNDGMNIAFFDGHVKWFSATNVPQVRSNL